MKFKYLLTILLIVGYFAIPSWFGNQPTPVYAQLGTAFTYQGRLLDGENLADGTVDFQFELHDAATGGSQVGSTVSKNDVEVNNGLISVELDFGTSIFTGQSLWLQIAVRAGNSAGAFTTLEPRQPLKAAPYALHAVDADAVPWAGVTGIPADIADGDDDSFAGFSCNNGQTLVWDATDIKNPHWECADSSSGDITAVNAGTGLTGGGTSGDVALSANTTYLQRRVSGTCPAGSSIRVINSTGTVSCETDTDTRGLNLPYFSSTSSSSAALDLTNNGSGPGLFGRSGASTGSLAYGVGGYNSTSTTLGILGDRRWGVYGSKGSGGTHAGYFNGNVQVVGTLSKSAGSFKIDHPLDPENKYLNHSFVESPDMMNVYNGNVTLDGNGEAWVNLPEWFEALNQDFRYQLTPLGAPGPNLYIAVEVQNNQFQIAGGEPGMRVSWQVTGIRHDPYAQANRIQVEEDKPAEEQGTYLYPEFYGGAKEGGAGPAANAPAAPAGTTR
jgi:hypothetical protein